MKLCSREELLDAAGEPAAGLERACAGPCSTTSTTPSGRASGGSSRARSRRTTRSGSGPGSFRARPIATAGRHGFLGMAMPEEHGGAGVDDFRFNVVIGEEVQLAGRRRLRARDDARTTTSACRTSSSYCNDEQRQRWLPGLASGELIAAIAMTEPGTGSDLAAIATRARRDNGALRGQRRQDLHHQRHQRRPRDHGRADRSRGRPPRPQPAGGRAGHGGLRARAEPGEDRPARAGHGGAVLQRRARARARTCSARRAPASCIWSPTSPQERLSIAVAAVAAAAGGARLDARRTSRTAGRSDSRSARSRTRASRSRTAARRSSSDRRSSTAASRRWSPAS